MASVQLPRHVFGSTQVHVPKVGLGTWYLERSETKTARLGLTPRQVALAFLTRRPSFFAIPKSTNPEHLRENAGGASVSLSAQDVAAIEHAFPVGRHRRGVAML